MRDIPLTTPPAAIPRYTFLNYGDTRTGKTFFGATMPRPLIIADATESGYNTIPNMDRDWWFEKDVEPIIVAVESMSDVAALMPRLDTLIAQKRIYSVVFDAFSFYVDLYLNGLIMAQTKYDPRSAYGQLGIHLRQVRTSIHARPISVMWNCLAKHPDPETDPKGRPLIPGQQADKFSAGVDFLIYSRTEQIREGKSVVGLEHQIRTRQYQTYIVGNRLGDQANALPDPFVGNYGGFLDALGHDVAKIRAAMPKCPPYTPPMAVTKMATPPAAKPIAKPNNVSAPKVSPSVGK